MLRIIAAVMVSSVLTACASVQTPSVEWESLNSETIALFDKGEYDRASLVAKRSIELAENAMGVDHPSVARSLNNLAAIYQAQGQYAQAEPLYRRSLAIVEKALDANHPVVATSLNNLAEVLRAQRHFLQAEPLQLRAIAIFEQSLGPDHPDLATSLNNLALLYQAQGRDAKAEALYQRSLTIFEKVLIPDHPDILTTTPAKLTGSRPRRGLASLNLLAKVLDNLTILYRETNRMEAIVDLEARATRIRAIKRQAALPPVVEITADTITINGIEVTPSLSKELFLKALGEPPRFVRGEPGTHMSDGYLYDAMLGLRFHTRPGEEDVTGFSIFVLSLSHRDRTWSKSAFDGTITVFGKQLPLYTTVQNIHQTIPELELALDTESLSPAQANTLGFYAAKIGKWNISVRADSETGAVKSLNFPFRPVVCQDDRQSDCFEKTTGNWRRGSQ